MKDSTRLWMIAVIFCVVTWLDHGSDLRLEALILMGLGIVVKNIEDISKWP